MEIICPECGKLHKLVDAQLPAKKFAAKCKQCGARMVIDPLTASDKPLNPPKEASPKGHPPTSTTGEFDILLTESYDEDPKEAKVSAEIKKEKADTEDIETVSAAETTGDNNDLFTVFPKLQDLSPDIFVYPEIFPKSNKHGYKTRENRRIFKIVDAVHDLLTTGILAEGEQVFRVAKGIAYHPFEIPYANGLMTMLSNYFAIVCTDRRLLLINVDFRLNHPTRYLFQIPYGEIAAIGRGIYLSSIVINSRSGRNWNFTTVSRDLARTIRDFVAAKLDEGPVEPTVEKPLRQLCPSCRTPLTNGLTACPLCSTVFKNPREALIRSLIMPGLGSIYLSHLPLGIMEMTGYLFSWLLTIALLIIEVPGGIGVALIPVLAYHLVAGLLAWKTAGKGYLVENRPVTAIDKKPEIGKEAKKNIGQSEPVNDQK